MPGEWIEMISTDCVDIVLRKLYLCQQTLAFRIELSVPFRIAMENGTFHAIIKKKKN